MHSSTRIVGSLISPVVVTAVAVAAGWRAAIVVSAGLVVIGAVVMLLAAPGTRSSRGAGTSAASFSLREGAQRNIAICTIGCVVCWRG